MMEPRQFVPVPYDALNACGNNNAERGIVLGLYQRAHQMRWAPIRFTERDLLDGHKLGNRRLWSLLTQLCTGLGLGTLERGNRLTMSTITLFCPTKSQQQSEQHGEQHGEQQSEQHNNPGSPDVNSQGAAQPTAERTARPTAERTAPPILRPETKTSDSDLRDIKSPAGWASLSKRARTALEGSNITGLGQAALFTAEELKARNGIGAATVDEVIQALALDGKQLRASVKKPKAEADPVLIELGKIWQERWAAAKGSKWAWAWYADSRALEKFKGNADHFAAACDAYLLAEATGDGVWPHDKPPTLAKMARDPSTWLNAKPAESYLTPNRRTLENWDEPERTPR